jgi:hypothetical protein
MKKISLLIAATLLSFCCMGQAQLAFPFQGGKDVMINYFKNNLVVTPDIMKKRATGMVLFKFSADEKGKISKMIIYYADDAILAAPVIDALKKSNHKWVIPDHETLHDFIIPFSFNVNNPNPDTLSIVKLYKGIANRKTITTTNQVPLDMATLLPAITINYDIL